MNKFKKNNKFKIIDIAFVIFLIYLLITSGITVYNEVKSENIDIIFNFYQLLLGCIALYILTLISNIITRVWVFAIYIGIKIALNKYKKEKLNKDDLSKDREYYRNIIDKYSPAVLSYIDDFNIDESDILATIMSLELKKKIKWNDEIVILDETMDNLDENEKYIFRFIIENKLTNVNIFDFKKCVEKDAKNYELIEGSDVVKKNRNNIIKKFIIIGVGAILFIMSLFTSISILNIQNQSMVLVIFMVVILLVISSMAVPGILFAYSVTYYTKKLFGPYVRTKSGENVNKELEGLKNYLKDFSNIENENKDAIALWEDYLIYSVMFGQNNEIMKEYNIKLEKLKNNI